ncbi:MAG TPA: adenylate/guanylate cyclase domain-containing protein [Candidatus Limnocylindrales bacterium]
MTCGRCGTANVAGRRFCLECGAPLSAGCPACGAANEAAAKFCGACGTRLGEPLDGGATRSSAGPAGASAAAERRVVSVMFVDLVGFTALAEDRDPEAVRELLSRYFDAAAEIVRRYGGSVEKFIGDAVMAVWGTPVAFEDDAERAVRAALDIVDAVPSLGSEAGLDLRARAGVLTGEAAVTVGAVGQGMVAGDLVNTASRLQAAASPGAVFVGEATRQASGATIAYEPAGDATLKGKSSPVPAFRALRVIADRGGTGRSDVLEPPFVGRADELRFIKEQFHVTGRERRARLVSLVGQAGIGKSRLAWELEKYLDGVVETVWWHRGRSPAYGEGVTFWALGEMIRRRAGLAEGDDEPTTRAAVATMLERHVPDAEERRWIEPRLFALLGLEGAPSGGREELFAAWRTLFERIAASGTVALVFEDLQWSDDGLLDFIEQLLDWSRSHPIFVVTLARPELLERRPGWGTDRRGAVAMRLDPLTESAMRELLAGIVPGLPEPVVARILARADGIPLYAVETIRMFLADGRLVAENGVFRPSGDLGDIDVPPTLHALVAARLDALPAADRTLLQDAAVLGQSFSLPALAAVTGDDPDALAPRLTALVRRELLVVETDPRAPTRGQHAFIQSLIREVAYATLSKRERRARHLAAARYFESLDDVELAGALATHYLAAYRAAPEGPEGEAAAAQARVALRGATDRAEALGALGQAVDSLRAALEVTPDRRDHAALLQRMAWIEGVAARFDEGERDAVAAVDAWRAIGDRAGALDTIAVLVHLQLSRGHIAQAMATLKATAGEAEALREDPSAQASVATFAEIFARGFFRSAHYEEAVSWADRALALAERLRLDVVVVMALITKGTSLEYLGRHREGLALLNGAYLDATAQGLHVAALRAGVNLAALTSDTDPRVSLQWTREGMTLARRLGLTGFAFYHASNTGSAQRLGEWAWIRSAIGELADGHPDPSEAQAIHDVSTAQLPWQGEDVGGRPAEVVADAQRDEDPQALANGYRWALDEAFAREDLGVAAGYGRRLLEYDFASSNDRFWAGRAALHVGDVATAERVMAMIEASPGGAADADVAALRAGIAARQGRIDDALAGYRAALATYRDMGLRFDLAMAGLDMAALVGPEVPAVRAAAAESRAILMELGARPVIARLDRLVPAHGSGSGGPPAASEPVASAQPASSAVAAD